MISLDKTYQTRDGRPVRLLCTDSGLDSYPVLGLVTNDSPGGFTEKVELATWTGDGHFYKSRTESEADLIEAAQPEPISPEPVMSNISLDKTYCTKDGRAVRILCTDAKGDYPVVGLLRLRDGTDDTNKWTTEGSFYRWDNPSNLDLVEVSPYAEFKVDDPVLARNFESSEWYPAYFAGTDGTRPLVFKGGRSSWTLAESTKAVAEVSRPGEER